MEHLMLVSGSLALGVLLGVLLMAILAAAHPDELPESRRVRPRAGHTSGPTVREPSCAGVEASHLGWSVVSIAEPTRAVSGTQARDSV